MTDRELLDRAADDIAEKCRSELNRIRILAIQADDESSVKEMHRLAIRKALHEYAAVAIGGVAT